MTVRITTAEQSRAMDSASIEQGNPSLALMQRAGAAAASIITSEYAPLLHRGVAIYAGAGNNGGDAWVVAGALAQSGVRVRIWSIPPRTNDANFERHRALQLITEEEPLGDEGVIVDGLLGTGAAGKIRAPVDAAIQLINDRRSRGAKVVSLDIPSGLNSDNGEHDLAVHSDLTVSFGTLKRGLLLNRDLCGVICTVDIGLAGANAELPNQAQSPLLVTHQSVLELMPQLSASVHKGDRGRVAVVGGGTDMFGAAALAGKAALRAGAGLLRLVVSKDNVATAQASMSAAISSAWWDNNSTPDPLQEEWAQVAVVGPGLGRSEAAAQCVALFSQRFAGPVVLDADGLNHFEGREAALLAFAESRQLVLTPHAAEMSRLTGRSVADVLTHRFELVPEYARRIGAVVLLKGVPTVIAAPDGRLRVSAAGTPVLATGGSGDMLAGMLAALLAQSGDPFGAGCIAAWAHGRAGELAAGSLGWRGHVLDDVLHQLPHVWASAVEHHSYPLLSRLPAVRTT